MYNRFLFSASIILFGILQPSHAHAWGKFGHVLVCEIAYRNLTDNSRKQLNTLLSADEEYTSFNRSCLEEDEFPRVNKKDHFANYDRKTQTITEPGCPGGRRCILSAIQREFKILIDKDSSAQKRADALLGLGHWVGDIHQPLHISFADDRGGNKIKKRGKCSASNLHAVWDNCIVDKRILASYWLEDYLENYVTWSKFTRVYRAADRLIEKTKKIEIAEWVKSDPWQWAAESYAIVLDPAVGYCVKVGSECWYSEQHKTYSDRSEERIIQMTNEYLDKFEATVELRLRQAGYRLAHMLNLALDSD